jgi:hypothetical protein
MIGVPSQPKPSQKTNVSGYFHEQGNEKVIGSNSTNLLLCLCFLLLVILLLLTSIYFSTQGLSNAHASNPPVAKMKMNTTASSFRESRSMHEGFG